MRERMDHTDHIGHVMRLERVYRQSAARVFRAFTEPEAVRAWWGPKGWATPHVEMDLRVGGRYRFGMHELNDSGEPVTELMFVRGQYLAIEPGHLLEFTYVWEPGGEGERWREFALVDHQTTVRVEFRGDGAGTRLVITHSGFPDEHGRDAHVHGWSSNNDQLEEYLMAQDSDGY